MTKNTHLTPEADGSYWVELSTLGRRDVNGLRKEPLSEAGCEALIERARTGQLRGEVGHPVPSPTNDSMSWAKRASMVKESEVGFAVTDLTFTRIDGIQAIRGQVHAVGPRKEVVLTRISNNEPLYFGLRAITETPKPGSDDPVRIIQVISWDLIDNDPYPVPAV
jgi:hypothetical protein